MLSKIHKDISTAFWKSCINDPIGATAGFFFFYILQRITGNKLNPVALNDSEVAKLIGLNRNKIPQYRDALKQRGLLEYVKTGGGRFSETTYSLPNHLLKNQHLISSNCSERGILVDINAQNKAVTVSERFIAEKRKANGQAKEIAAVFLQPYNTASLQSQLMQLKVDYPTYQRLVKEVLTDWIEAGVCHDDMNGNLDMKDAVRHLQNTLRIKANALLTAPKTREDLRHDLENAARERFDSLNIDELEYKKVESVF